MKDTLSEMYLSDEDLKNYDIDLKYLDKVFPDFFNALY